MVYLTHAVTWMNAENILNESGQTPKDHMLCDSIYMSWPSKSKENKKTNINRE